MRVKELMLEFPYIINIFMLTQVQLISIWAETIDQINENKSKISIQLNVEYS